jgi:hypothetical protein
VSVANSYGDGSPKLDPVINLLIQCCSDSDSSTMKFACFGLGNAAFHTSALYPFLGACIAPLVAALNNNDEKTRANAAGALGNLVRNGNQLCGPLVQSGAIQRLIFMVRNDADISPRRIALFSLGTLAAHSICRGEMGICKPSASDLLRSLSAKATATEITGTRNEDLDESLAKYAERLKGKLRGSSSGGSRPSSGDNAACRK